MTLYLKTTLKVVYWAVTILLVGFAVLAVASSVNLPGGRGLFVVQSGSMEPSIRTGSLVVVGPQASYAVDDVVTYRRDEGVNGTVVTHRVVEIMQSGAETLLTTKGDANDGIDRIPVTPDAILGRVSMAIPYVGYVVAFAQTRFGLMLLLVVPACMLIASELVKIRGEIEKYMTAWVERRQEI